MRRGGSLLPRGASPLGLPYTLARGAPENPTPLAWAHSRARSPCIQPSNHVPGHVHRSSGAAENSRGVVLRGHSASKYNRSDRGASVMSIFRRAFSSSVGTKLLMGLTGLALFAYLVLHLIGNA